MNGRPPFRRTPDARAIEFRRRAFAALPFGAWALFAFGKQHDEPKPGPANVDSAVKSVFVQNCAPCHGETGDGKGTTKLDKPARSFKDGGFAYGNTPETLLRTITNGIPGTPMPSFSRALKEEQRQALAQYVIALGPEQIEVKSSDTILVVHDKPLIVRGKLPPIIEGAPERPRGLLIGTLDGLTFEYRTDDVRLLGVRQGAFVDRKDWGGRGGDALQPLANVTQLYEHGDPRGLYSYSDDKEDNVSTLHAVFRGTWVRGEQAGVQYDLVDEARRVTGGSPRIIARVEEQPFMLASSLGNGFARKLRITSELRPACRMHVLRPYPSFPSFIGIERNTLFMAGTFVLHDDHTADVILARVDSSADRRQDFGTGDWSLPVTLEAGQTREVLLVELPRVTLGAGDWRELYSRVLEEFGQ